MHGIVYSFNCVVHHHFPNEFNNYRFRVKYYFYSYDIDIFRRSYRTE
jgi:hypothetical protein